MSPRIRPWFRYLGIVTVSLGVAILLLTGFVVRRERWSVHPILSGSMGDAAPVGSLVFIRPLLPDEYENGDVVMFKAPVRTPTLVTHRIIGLFREEGVRVMRTKGDANTVEDPWLTSVGAIVGRKEFGLPYAGYLVVWVRSPVGFLIVGTLGLLVILKEVAYLINLFGRDSHL